MVFSFYCTCARFRDCRFPDNLSEMMAFFRDNGGGSWWRLDRLCMQISCSGKKVLMNGVWYDHAEVPALMDRISKNRSNKVAGK